MEKFYRYSCSVHFRHFEDCPDLIKEIVSFLKCTGGTSLVRMVFLDHDSNDKMNRFMQCASIFMLCFQKDLTAVFHVILFALRACTNILYVELPQYCM